MRIVIISDVHNKINKVKLPPGDLLIIAGDFSNLGTPQEFIKFNADLENIKQQFKGNIVCIPGNHDNLAEKDFYTAKILLTNVSHFIHHQQIEIDGIKIFGSAYTPTFGSGWAFNVDRGKDLKEKWSQIPHDTDILITHGQPYGILDWAWNERVGDKDLLDAIIERPNIKLVIGGHLHSGYGTKEFNGTLFINASICDEQYLAVNKPIVVDYDINTKTFVIV